MTKTEKKERKEKFKKFLLRALHIVSYILSILFIGLCIFTGVQSCSKKPQSNNVSSSKQNDSSLPVIPLNELFVKTNVKKSLPIDPNNYYVYSLKYDGLKLISFEGFCDFYDIPKNNLSDVGPDLYATLVNPSGSYLLTPSGEVYENYTWYMRFVTAELDNGDYRYILLSLSAQWLDLNGTIQSGHLFTMNEYVDSMEPIYLQSYMFYDFDLVFTEDIVSYYPFDFLYEKVDTQLYYFNENFNYNSPFMYSYETGFIPDDSETESGWGYPSTVGDYLIIESEGCWFSSNGQLFNCFVLRYLVSNGNNFNMWDSEKPYICPADQMIYYSMSYRNSLTGREVLVNKRNTVTGSVDLNLQQGPVPFFAYTRGSTWQDPNYRKITIVGQPILNGYFETILNSFNNTSGSLSGGNFITGDNNVFVLLSTAFVSLNDFWAIYILPGITIGTLFFLPLIVGIVVTVFWMIKR